MTEADSEICTICADACESEAHTLACGHTFHVECIVHWFRRENTTCPNCRSEQEDRYWTRYTPGRRIDMLRRKFKSLPKSVQRKIQKMDSYRLQRVQLRKEQNELRRRYTSVFASYNRLTSRIRHSSTQYRQIRNDLVYTQATVHVPLLAWEDEEEDSSSFFSSDDE